MIKVLRQKIGGVPVASCHWQIGSLSLDSWEFRQLTATAQCYHSVSAHKCTTQLKFVLCSLKSLGKTDLHRSGAVLEQRRWEWENFGWGWKEVKQSGDEDKSWKQVGGWWSEDSNVMEWNFAELQRLIPRSCDVRSESWIFCVSRLFICGVSCMVPVSATFLLQVYSVYFVYFVYFVYSLSQPEILGFEKKESQE